MRESLEAVAIELREAEESLGLALKAISRWDEDGDAREHWPALAEWEQRIMAAKVQVGALRELHPEVAKAIQDERDEDDRLSDLADAASY